jgi:hypothetical protein
MGRIDTSPQRSRSRSQSYDSVVGRKVHISFGLFALIIDEVQIIKEARS